MTVAIACMTFAVVRAQGAYQSRLDAPIVATTLTWDAVCLFLLAIGCFFASKVMS